MVAEAPTRDQGAPGNSDIAAVDTTAAGKAVSDANGDEAPAAVAAPPKVEAAALEAAAHPGNDLTEPTAAQQSANNAKAGHVNLHGLDVTIQVPKGGLRRGTDRTGKPWERAASDHYGHIKRTTGGDGEQVDVYLGPHAEAPDAKVFVIDQVKPGTKLFDETKSMVGYPNGKAARASYQKNFPKGLDTFGGIREMSIDEFKAWAKSDAARKPVTDKVRTTKEIPPPAKGKRESKTVLAERAKALAESKPAEPTEERGAFRQAPSEAERALEAGGESKEAAHKQVLTDAVRNVVKNWGENAPAVKVVASAEDLPAIAKENPRYRSAKGFYDGKHTAYIVAGNHKDAASALTSLAHEAIGHHGVDNILNEHMKGGWDHLAKDIADLRSSGKGSAAMRDVLDNVAKRYPDADARTYAMETLAVMAERGIRNGLIGRAIAAIKAYLRKILPGVKFTEADLRQMLARSEEFIRAGTPLEERQQAFRALAFDQPAESAGLTGGERNNPTVAADAARAWREQGTDSPYFQKFFAGSKVVKNGKPIEVYHGTASDHTVFTDKALGEATGHSSAPLGHFFTEDRSLAEGYARNASEGRPADERVVDAYVAIKNPYEMKLSEAQALESPQQARALQQKLRAQGYDGIHIAEAKSWVAFDSGQIKSAENRGTFDPKHGDINFSLPEASIDTLHEVLAKPDERNFASAKDWLRGKAENFRPAALGALQRRHLTELMDSDPALKGYGKQYDERAQKLDADRQTLISGAHDAAEHPNDMLKKGGANISDELQKFAYEKGPAGWFGRQKPEAKRLADVQNEATIQGLDPSEEYTKLVMEDKDGHLVAWNPALIKDKIKALRGQMRGRPGDDKRAMMDQVKMLKNLPAREAKRIKTWPQLLAAYQALSPEAKRLYKEQRDWHSQMRDETEKGLIARVEAIGRDMAGTTGAEMAQRHVRQTVQRIRLQFEMNRLEGVYFPLNRDGDYWMSVSDASGAQGFKMFESADAAAAAEKKLRAAGFKIDAQGRRDNSPSAKSAPSGTFIAEVISQLRQSGAPEKALDEVYQTFLKTLPEMSMRKHSIHRKKVPGFEDDAVRAFAKNAFHGAHQLAKLRHGHELSSIVEGAQLNLDNYRREGANKTLDVAKADALLAELKKRHEYIMSPKDTQLANVANSIGFLYHLGASPASALVNLTQNAQVTLPVLGAHHGWGKASRAMAVAVRDALRTGGNIDRTLTSAEERMAYNTLRERGDITTTASHTLAGLAEGNRMSTNPAWAKAMTGLSYLFHKAEVVNRQAAGMSSFRLARLRGDSFGDAVQYASDIINGTHFDYSAANRPRYMQGNTARVALQFKNYSIGMTWMLYRNLYQAFKGETPQVRSVARKTLTGILGMTAVMAGSMGLPIINALRYGANAAHALFGDDEPFDFNTEYRAWLAEHLGEDAAKYVADGAINRTGLAVSQRVSLSDLWFREPDRDLEGKDAYYAMLEGLVGPLGGIAKNLFVGTKMIGDGNVQRGIETMMPKFAKDAMKATRYAHDGSNTLRGDPIVADVTTPETFIQGLGFTPTRLFEQQRTNSALKNYEQAILDRRASLLNALAMATHAGDSDDRTAALAKIHAFNIQYPEIALASESIRQSLRARARYSATAESGIFLNKKIAPRLREQVGVGAE